MLLAGASWQTLAKQYSIDPGSKDKGGLYTDVTSGQMVAAFSKVAFSLPLHVLSPPVKTQYGWFIITVTKNTKGSTTSCAKVEASIKSTLLQTQAADGLEQLAHPGQQSCQSQLRHWLRPREARP